MRSTVTAPVIPSVHWPSARLSWRASLAIVTDRRGSTSSAGRLAGLAASLDYAHICVATRPGFDPAQAPPAVAAEMARRAASAQTIRAQPHGLFLLDTTLALEICSSGMRERLRAKMPDARASLKQDLPACVWRYICEHHLYSQAHFI